MWRLKGPASFESLDSLKSAWRRFEMSERAKEVPSWIMWSASLILRALRRRADNSPAGQAPVRHMVACPGIRSATDGPWESLIRSDRSRQKLNADFITRSTLIVPGYSSISGSNPSLAFDMCQLQVTLKPITVRGREQLVHDNTPPPRYSKETTNR